MTGGNQVVGLWPDRAPLRTVANSDTSDAMLEGSEDIAPDVDDASFDDPDPDPEPSPGERWRTGVSLLCLIAAIGWLGFLGWIEAPHWLATPPDAFRVALVIALACPPLALLAMVHSLAHRGSRAESGHYLRAADALRAENQRLEATLAHVEAKLAAGRVSVAETSQSLMALGEDTAVRMQGVANTMRTEVDIIGTQAQALRSSAASARADLAVLLSDLPKAHSESRKMVAQIDAAGTSANEAAAQLEARLIALSARGREADEIASGAAQQLAVHLARVESVSASAGDRLAQASALMAQSVDTALDHAARASDAARQGLEAQGAAMMALADQAQAALAKTGAESGEAIATRIADAQARVETMARQLAEQSATTARLIDTLRTGLDDLDTRFAGLDDANTVRGGRIADTLDALSAHTGSLSTALETGSARAETLIGRTEKLMTALDATRHELDETLPAAFERIDARATTSRQTLATVAPEVAAVEASAGAALDRLMEAEALLAKQQALLQNFADTAEARIAASREAAAALTSELSTADSAAHALAEGASASLIDAMIRVRETAQTASERAREAISRVIPDAADQLSEATREALSRTISEQVGMHIADLTATAERALETAHHASDRLMRQMLTIADTSAAVEARIEEAKAQTVESDRDNFARRVALLIESLNSTAIDITKVLSNEVTDSAWAAYLRGDRTVFTRRAVRLLDTTDAREILRHYDTDTEFREQVNRYIHDFEAMLRNTLSTRDGSALSVTLLSSDMGKLYVALAQAIERLRH